MSDDATTSKSKLAIGFGKFLGTVALSVMGGASVAGWLNTNEKIVVVNNGTQFEMKVQSGVQLRLNGGPHWFSDTIPLTATGGDVSYDLVSVDPADYFTGSGFLTKAMVMWIRSPKVINTDLDWATAIKTATGGTLIRNMQDVPSSTGGLVIFSTGALRWNSAYRLKLASMGTPNTAMSGYLLIEGYEDLSE